jgi:hypothetical protein
MHSKLRASSKMVLWSPKSTDFGLLALELQRLETLDSIASELGCNLHCLPYLLDVRPVMTGDKTDQFQQSGGTKDGVSGRSGPFSLQPV